MGILVHFWIYCSKCNITQCNYYGIKCSINHTTHKRSLHALVFWAQRTTAVVVTWNKLFKCTCLWPTPCSCATSSTKHIDWALFIYIPESAVVSSNSSDSQVWDYSTIHNILFCYKPVWRLPSWDCSEKHFYTWSHCTAALYHLQLLCQCWEHSRRWRARMQWRKHFRRW